jgi:hypothetical protein
LLFENTADGTQVWLSGSQFLGSAHSRTGGSQAADMYRISRLDTVPLVARLTVGIVVMERGIMWKPVVTALLAVGVGASAIVGLGAEGWNPFASASAGPSRTAVVCPAADPVKVGDISVPAGPVAGFCQDRLVNAAHVMNAARDLDLGTHTQAVGVMTAIGESGLRVLDYGDSAGADSRGLFQQRDNGAWGSLADRMDPFISAHNFFVKVTDVPGWRTMDPSLLAHSVQVNSDPNHYSASWTDAEAIVAALSGP